MNWFAMLSINLVVAHVTNNLCCLKMLYKYIAGKKKQKNFLFNLQVIKLYFHMCLDTTLSMYKIALHSLICVAAYPQENLSFNLLIIT